jgi:diadenylate cyclase
MRDLIVAFRWRDAVDILLVAAVVYRGLLLFQGTRSVQMLVGLAVLVGGSFLARHLELWTITWILDNFWSFWAIALIVLFQPELRRALTRIGQGRLWLAFGGARAAERAHVVDELVKTAQTLSARRIGALIVFERTAGLRYYVELGVPLDALVSADLLETVFLPQSPLHDGAVIIQGDRARAAGCFLPLSRSTQTARQLGTRHRAALGISEESDAIALVVSEETGRVVITVDGDIETMPDAASLRQRLQELIEGVAPAPVSAPRVAARLKLGA